MRESNDPVAASDLEPSYLVGGKQLTQRARAFLQPGDFDGGLGRRFTEPDDLRMRVREA